jgi:hypothetical protein
MKYKLRLTPNAIKDINRPKNQEIKNYFKRLEFYWKSLESTQELVLVILRN